MLDLEFVNCKSSHKNNKDGVEKYKYYVRLKEGCHTLTL